MLQTYTVGTYFSALDMPSSPSHAALSTSIVIFIPLLLSQPDTLHILQNIDIRVEIMVRMVPLELRCYLRLSSSSPFLLLDPYLLKTIAF